jgi:hypothetical protein
VSTGRSELTRLADVASQHCTGDAVAIVRGFDRKSRERARTLHSKLTCRGVPSIDVSPMTARMRRAPAMGGSVIAPGQIGLVLDAGEAPTGEAQRLAAELGVPVLRAKAGPAVNRPSVLGLFTDDVLVDVALDSVAVLPLDADECQLALAEDDLPPCLVTGPVRLHLDHPEVGRTDQIAVTTGQQTMATTSPLRLAPHWGPWSLHADSSPLRPLDAPMEIRCLLDRVEQITA